MASAFQISSSRFLDKYNLSLVYDVHKHIEIPIANYQASFYDSSIIIAYEPMSLSDSKVYIFRMQTNVDVEV
jgi:hypothetical protein